MREANFSIPSANKASVGITPALYDRRALDCTSTLPLINSLNNLAYLTTSSARIRDILTVDGGVEKLVCILKEGRSKDAMESWKWNLAFQCVFNIGVRGSETVRTRVVEADMVPVVATVLENYIQAVEKLNKRADEEARRKSIQMGLFEPTAANASRTLPKQSRQLSSRSERGRRTAPPPIEIPTLPAQPFHPLAEEMDRLRTTGSLTPQANVTAGWRTQERAMQRPREDRHVLSPVLGSQRREQPVTTPPYQHSLSPFGLRPVRDIDRLPSMLPTLHAELSSQPQSPTTPSVTAPGSPRSATLRPRRRPSIRHQLSISGNWESEHNDDSSQETSDTAEASPEPMVGIQNDIVMQDIVGDDGMLEGSATPVALTAVPTVNVAHADNFITSHRSDQETANAAASPPAGRTGFAPAPPLPPVDLVNATPPTLTSFRPGLSYMPAAPAPLLAALPRDEDIIMSLQLLAYVSKYCNLRSYFQQSHLVARLKIDAELKTLDADYDATTPYTGPSQEELDEAWDNEFVPKADEPAYNIFPLIEKFTVRCSSSRQSLLPTSSQHSETMQYWAGVVMRNLCRKDESRGGIRQCAYWKCGKWEEYTRQFAKCRRCRRTKYCSKECQKGAWGSHRFWCVAADEAKEGEHSRHHQGHSRNHHHHHHSTQQQQQQQQSAQSASRDASSSSSGA
ncbi:hypothetical protein AAFC00_006288 [Neodothiora populina]|uniref:MYND-type zinc finger protein samB n=1 Tax=Neodothiora populina TaxID=2781224 RepID=A0ABR3P4N4_9PEZI